MDNQTIGQRIRALRRSKKLTQAQLAKIAGVSSPAVTEWEKDSYLPKAASLEAIAKTVGGTVQQATDLTMENPMLANVGPEPKVVGNAFALAANKLSAPIEGNTGVYVVKNTSTVKAPALKDYKPYVAKLDAQK